MKASKVLLCIPPIWENFEYPTLSIPSLAGYLQEKGICVYQCDLNIEFREFLRGKVTARPISGSNEASFCPNNKCISHFSNLYLQGNQFKGHYYSQYLDPKQGFTYANIVASAFSVLPRFIKDEQANIYYSFYAEKDIIARIENMDIGVLGISITSESQVVAAFSLSYLVKRTLPRIHISIGGPWPTLFWKTLIQNEELSEFFDTLVVSEGEMPLHRLVQALVEGSEIGNVPGLLTSSNPQQSPMPWSADLSQLPSPIFDGLPLDRYDKPGTLTYQTARGCYWDKCTFCEHRYVQACTYREKPIEQVLQDIAYLVKKYPARTILFTDTAVPPKRFKQIAEGIIMENIKISWWCFARLEGNFTREIFELGKRAGCMCIQFGLESANERISALMQKGVGKKTASRVIKECHEAGIQVVVSVIIGFPTETAAEAQETIDFLMAHREFIDFPQVNFFSMRREIPIYRNPAKYKVELKETPEERLKFSLDYIPLEGISADEAMQMKTRFYSAYWPESAPRGCHLATDEAMHRVPMLPNSARIFQADFDMKGNQNTISRYVLSFSRGLSESGDDKQYIFGKDVIAFLDLCNGKHTFGEIISILANKFGLPINDIKEQYIHLFNDALNKNFLRVRDYDNTDS